MIMAKRQKDSEERLTVQGELTAAFVAELRKQFEEHGPLVLAEMRESSPTKFAQLIAKLVPTEIQVTGPSGVFDNCGDMRALATRLLVYSGADESRVTIDMVDAAVVELSRYAERLEAIASRAMPAEHDQPRVDEVAGFLAARGDNGARQ
jgi:hypothetical protein